MRLLPAFAFSLSILTGSVVAGPEMAGHEGGGPGETTVESVRRTSSRQAAKRYAEIAPQAVYARPEPAPIAHVYGTRRYAGLTYMIVPGQWYPPVWEDACAVKRTCAIPGVAPWPGVRVDINSDEVPLAPVGPPPIPVTCFPGGPRP